MNARGACWIGALGLVACFAVAGWAEERGQSGELSPVLKLSDVNFPHELHFAVLELECESCHHETQAKALDIPHADYFADFWIKCVTCHREGRSASKPLACKHCHHASPVDIADETLSAKVVIHRSCWGCHEVGTGAQASQSCRTCHTGNASQASTQDLQDTERPR